VESPVGLKLIGTHQLLVSADDVNLLGDNVDTIEKNRQTLIDASKEVGLEVNTEKTKYMLLSRHQNAGQNHDIKIGNRSFENAAQFYMCEMWSVVLREEHRLRVFVKRVLRIFGPKWAEVTGGWRKLRNEELHNLYSSPSIIRR
ncbi:hypothetical protein B7P43_G13126, partial [Cryptotermes secundus]